MTDTVPAPARLEILEQHRGDKYDDHMPLLPNIVRVNGRALWCSADNPVVVQDINPASGPIVVTLRLQARVLSVGSDLPEAEPATAEVRGERAHFARVMVPVMPEDAVGGEITTPYVVVDGHRLLLAGPVEIDSIQVPGADLVTVAVPLVCRSVLFDDEPTPG